MQPTPKDAEIHITQLGMLANLILALGKGTAGYLFHSQALLSDGLHSLTDLIADLITLASVSWPSSTTAVIRSRSHWYPKTTKSLLALAVSCLLLFGGVIMGASSLHAIYTLTFSSEAHQAHGDIEAPALNAAWVAMASILVKEWLYQHSMYIS